MSFARLGGGSSGRRLRARLAELGWRAGPRRLGRGESAAVRGELLITLPRLGPGFCAFAAFLAGRSDLLGPEERARLEAAAKESFEAACFGRCEALLAENGLDLRPSETREREPRKRSIGLLGVELRGRLADGARVRALLHDPEHLRAVRADLEHLPMLRQPLEALGLPTEPLFVGFQRALDRELDLGARQVALESLGREFAGSDLLAVPRVLGHRGEYIVWVEDLGGYSLLAANVSQSHSQDRAFLVRRVALAWLHLALLAGKIETEAELFELADGRIGLGLSALGELEQGSRARVWGYLRAVSAEESETASRALLAELGLSTADPRGRRLGRRLRQLVPFRDAGFRDRSQSSSRLGEEAMGEYVALHWRLATEEEAMAGHMDGLFRGLLSVDCLCKALAPGRDGLKEGLEALEWRAGWSQLRMSMGPERLLPNAVGYVEGMLELPASLRRLREAGTEAGGPSAGAGASRERLWNRTIAGLGLLFLMALLSLGLGMIKTGAGAWAWADPVGFILFVLLGGIFLRLVGRQDPERRGQHTRDGYR